MSPRADRRCIVLARAKHLDRKQVHALRIAARRLSQWATANPSCVEHRRRFARDLKGLCQALSATRDDDACIRLLASLPLSADATRTAKRLIKSLERRRRHQGPRIGRYQRHLCGLVVPLRFRTNPAFVVKQMREVLAAPRSKIHRRRKIIRRLRHAIEVASPNRFRRIHAAARSAQQAYGRLCDLSVARSEVRKLSDEHKGKRALLTALKAERAKALARARIADEHLYRAITRALAVTERTKMAAKKMAP